LYRQELSQLQSNFTFTKFAALLVPADVLRPVTVALLTAMLFASTARGSSNTIIIPTYSAILFMNLSVFALRFFVFFKLA
jgi:hypothetical protein